MIRIAFFACAIVLVFEPMPSVCYAQTDEKKRELTTERKKELAAMAAHARREPVPADSPPAPVEQEKWLVQTADAARKLAALFVFGSVSEVSPPSDQYPYRKKWEEEQRMMGGNPMPGGPYPAFEHRGAVLEKAYDPWTPYVGRNDGRSVWRVWWRTKQKDGIPADTRNNGRGLEPKPVADLRYRVELTVWLDPIDGAFLRAMIRHAGENDGDTTMPDDACDAQTAMRELWASGPEFWRSCLTSPPAVPLVQAIEAGTHQIGGIVGSLAIVHAVNWSLGLGLNRDATVPIWSFQIWRTPPGPIMGPITNVRWAVLADSGKWETATNGATCPKHPTEPSNAKPTSVPGGKP